MKLLPDQTDEASLSCLGREALSLLENRDFQSLVDRFGYALAFGRSPAAVIEEKLHSCIAQYRASTEGQPSVLPSMIVKYFKPNDSGLFAVVECVFISPEGCPILAELIVTSSGEDKYATLEEVSLVKESFATDRFDTRGTRLATN
ncbi:MAG TPA: hypothetical protein VGM54_05165 [Chthoniobacter sp.]|jgi:hypothetical protein